MIHYLLMKTKSLILLGIISIIILLLTAYSSAAQEQMNKGSIKAFIHFFHPFNYIPPTNIINGKYIYHPTPTNILEVFAGNIHQYYILTNKPIHNQTIEVHRIYYTGNATSNYTIKYTSYNNNLLNDEPYIFINTITKSRLNPFLTPDRNTNTYVFPPYVDYLQGPFRSNAVCSLASYDLINEE